MITPEETTISVNDKEISVTTDNSDLEQLLSEATDTKPDRAAEPDAPEPESEGPEPNETDFTPKAEAPKISFEPERKVDPDIPYKIQAEIVTSFIDDLQQIILPAAYTRTIFNGAERKVIQEFKREGKPIESKEIIEKLRDVKELVDGLPFIQAEFNMISTSISAVMMKYQKSFSPEMMLFGALTSVMFPRIIPMFNKFG